MQKPSTSGKNYNSFENTLPGASTVNNDVDNDVNNDVDNGIALQVLFTQVE